ncbi:MAG: VWA domain-containing protein [Terracidiphilus sp.]
MLALATMRLCINAILATLLAGAALPLAAQATPTPAVPVSSPAPLSGVSGASVVSGVGRASQVVAALTPPTTLTPEATPTPQTPPTPQAPSLTVDRDPVRSPDGEPAASTTGTMRKEGTGYVLHTDVEEVVLNCTVLEGNRLVPDLKRDNFDVSEDGVKQTLISFQHTDLPVSIAMVVDNSGSMAKKRPSVNKSALDLIQASNPQDETFVVNFSDEAFIDQEFTSDLNKLRDGLGHIESRGGTALYDAVVASADKLVADAKRPKQVLILITDGEDNASTLNLEQTIRRVQQLSGPVIYSIGLLFGDEMSRAEVRHARRALEMLSTETGGIAFFPKSIEQIDQIAAEVARDIRNQYTLGYHSTKPTTEPGFRRVVVTADAKGLGKLTVRTRTGYFPVVRVTKKGAVADRK